MIVDKQLELDDAAALTSTRVSTNAIDLTTVRDIGKGKPLYAVVTVDTALDSTEEDAVLSISVITDDDAALGSPTTKLTWPNIAEASLGAGVNPIIIPIPYGIGERYLGLNYAVSVHNFTTGNISAFITSEPESAT